MDVPLPEADGSAETNQRPHPGGGYEYDEVPAWSEPLVRAYAAAQSAADNAALLKHNSDMRAEVTSLRVTLLTIRSNLQNRFPTSSRLLVAEIDAALKGASHE